MSISDDFSQAEFAAKHIASKSPIKPAVAIVLGSGLGGFADEMTDAVRISYNDIPHFARSTAVGHAGQLVLGNIGAWPVVVMQGRVHLYEGYPVHSVVFPMRVFSRMGVRAAILTNAAGGINLDYGQGRLVVIKDHINLQGQNPLVGPEDPNLGLRFIDMTEAYCKSYRQIALEAGRGGQPQDPEATLPALYIAGRDLNPTPANPNARRSRECPTSASSAGSSSACWRAPWLGSSCPGANVTAAWERR